MVTIIAAVMLAALAGFSVFKNMEAPATACIAGIMTILSTYIWGETKRPSNSKENENKS
jgi:hypothetical protein